MTPQEINRTLAERLFGWKWWKDPRSGQRWLARDDDGTFAAADGTEPVSECVDRLWPKCAAYYTSAELTSGHGGVLAKMAERGWYHESSQCLAGFEAQFTKNGWDGESTSGWATSGPELLPTLHAAICTAAAEALYQEGK